MLRPAIVAALLILTPSVALGQRDTKRPMSQSSDSARTRARVAALTAFRRSKTFERIGAIQREIASVTDPKELAAFHNSIDLSEETQLSPITELYYLLKAEVVFVQLRSPGKESLPTADALEQLSGYATLRRDQTDDPTFWLEYQILNGMYALQNGQKTQAESHLREFEGFTKSFNVPADAEYVAQMRRNIASNDLSAARRTLAVRMAAFFPQHFAEAQEALDRKIVIMTNM